MSTERSSYGSSIRHAPTLHGLLRDREIASLVQPKVFGRRVQSSQALLARMTLTQCLQAHRGHSSCLGLSHSTIVTCAGDNSIKVFDLEKSSVCSAPQPSSYSSTPSSDSHSYKRPASVWHPQRSFSCHGDRVKKIVTHRTDPSMFWTCSEDGTVRQFDLRDPTHWCSSSTRRSGRSSLSAAAGVSTGSPGQSSTHAANTHCSTLLLNFGRPLNAMSMAPTDPTYFSVAGDYPAVCLFDRRCLRECVVRYLPQGVGPIVLGSWSDSCVFLFDRDGFSGRYADEFSDDDDDGSCAEKPSGSSMDTGKSNSGDRDDDFETDDERDMSSLSDPVSGSGISDEEDEDRIHHFTCSSPFPLGAAPCVNYRAAYKGHANSQTVKDVFFMGGHDDYITSGSDDGCVYTWNKKSRRLVSLLYGDSETVNVIAPHPHLPVMAVSGIDDSIKVAALSAMRRQLIEQMMSMTTHGGDDRSRRGDHARSVRSGARDVGIYGDLQQEMLDTRLPNTICCEEALANVFPQNISTGRHASLPSSISQAAFVQSDSGSRWNGLSSLMAHAEDCLRANSARRSGCSACGDHHNNYANYIYSHRSPSHTLSTRSSTSSLRRPTSALSTTTTTMTTMTSALSSSPPTASRSVRVMTRPAFSKSTPSVRSTANERPESSSSPAAAAAAAAAAAVVRHRLRPTRSSQNMASQSRLLMTKGTVRRPLTQDESGRSVIKGQLSRSGIPLSGPSTSSPSSSSSSFTPVSASPSRLPRAMSAILRSRQDHSGKSGVTADTDAIQVDRESRVDLTHSGVLDMPKSISHSHPSLTMADMTGSMDTHCSHISITSPSDSAVKESTADVDSCGGYITTSSSSSSSGDGNLLLFQESSETLVEMESIASEDADSTLHDMPRNSSSSAAHGHVCDDEDMHALVVADACHDNLTDDDNDPVVSQLGLLDLTAVDDFSNVVATALDSNDIDNVTSSFSTHTMHDAAALDSSDPVVSRLGLLDLTAVDDFSSVVATALDSNDVDNVTSSFSTHTMHDAAALDSSDPVVSRLGLLDLTAVDDCSSAVVVTNNEDTVLISETDKDANDEIIKQGRIETVPLSDPIDTATPYPGSVVDNAQYVESGTVCSLTQIPSYEAPSDELVEAIIATTTVEEDSGDYRTGVEDHEVPVARCEPHPNAEKQTSAAIEDLLHIPSQGFDDEGFIDADVSAEIMYALEQADAVLNGSSHSFKVRPSDSGVMLGAEPAADTIDAAVRALMVGGDAEALCKVDTATLMHRHGGAFLISNSDDESAAGSPAMSLLLPMDETHAKLFKSEDIGEAALSLHGRTVVTVCSHHDHSEYEMLLMERTGGDDTVMAAQVAAMMEAEAEEQQQQRQIRAVNEAAIAARQAIEAHEAAQAALQLRRKYRERSWDMMRDLAGLEQLLGAKYDELVSASTPSSNIVVSWSPVAQACLDPTLQEHLGRALTKVEALGLQLRTVTRRKASNALDCDVDLQVVSCARNVVVAARGALEDLEAAQLRLV
ncbi:hypothetical protein BSLG_005598 [Batrachochytrium salamandrivorans]|nr:hypothetical protein BSLG_005598 [Batrachochytrium salamandrivorans]